ncbi:hypothetical protein HCH_06437 [Hahella chejuensis KCTC 2396]|uniref:Uncharacterized protein n=2 Tax=Hahella chejuensis TaxID=158327 RepID=Q2S8E2_HAHCH|nr:hypothetical protein HCH_06437 [Hahella chejuensis KCTC 2396]
MVTPMRLAPYRRHLIITEFVALAFLIGSMYLFAQMAKQGEVVSPRLWLIPIISSFLVISGFCGNLYIRWVESVSQTDGQSSGGKPVQRVFIYLLIVSLYIIWFMAVAQAWSSHQALSASP